MARILSVSYDQPLLYTRQLILEQPGHSVLVTQVSRKEIQREAI